MEQQTTDYTTQIISQVIHTWAAQNKAVTAFFNKYTNDDYEKEVAPGRNRAIYLLGHLVAVNDGMLPLFGLGDKLFPGLDTLFITAPDKAHTTLPSLATLKEHWEALNTTLTSHFNKMNQGEWMSRHQSVSEADFALNPSRNKLNVLLSRTTHQSYHLGQLNLLHV